MLMGFLPPIVCVPSNVDSSSFELFDSVPLDGSVNSSANRLIESAFQTLEGTLDS